jgi:hypothetical protein
MPEILKQKTITTIDDIIDLPVDWRRGNIRGLPSEKIKVAFSWFKDAAICTTIKVNNFWQAPERNDFPDWDHVGSHVRIAKAYWNWFHWYFKQSEKDYLKLSDSPDFYGEIYHSGKKHNFVGDFGIVSDSAFLLMQKHMDANDLWISVLNEGDLHIVIEPLYSIRNTFFDECNFTGIIEKKKSRRQR